MVRSKLSAFPPNLLAAGLLRQLHSMNSPLPSMPDASTQHTINLIFNYADEVGNSYYNSFFCTIFLFFSFFLTNFLSIHLYYNLINGHIFIHLVILCFQISKILKKIYKIFNNKISINFVFFKIKCQFYSDIFHFLKILIFSFFLSMFLYHN